MLLSNLLGERFKVFSLYNELNKIYEVIMDDRDVAAGVQFADADLLGVTFGLSSAPETSPPDRLKSSPGIKRSGS